MALGFGFLRFQPVNLTEEVANFMGLPAKLDMPVPMQIVADSSKVVINPCAYRGYQQAGIGQPVFLNERPGALQIATGGNPEQDIVAVVDKVSQLPHRAVVTCQGIVYVTDKIMPGCGELLYPLANRGRGSAVGGKLFHQAQVIFNMPWPGVETRDVFFARCRKGAPFGLIGNDV